MSTSDGAVLYVKPMDGATTPPEEFSREGLARFSMGLTDGPTDGTFAKTDDGEYEVRAFGPAQTEGAEMVARYYFWEITRRMSWEEWDRQNAR